MKQTYAIALHGGAENNRRKPLKPELKAAFTESLERIIQVGDDYLRQGESAVDTVTHVASLLENDPLFNAGHGSVLNRDAEVECDAAIMDGHLLQAGAVAAVRRIRNPITAARAVLEHSEHVMLVADGAEEFVSNYAVEMVEPSYFVTPLRQRQYQKAHDHYHMGTIGVVALDQNGHLAAATSTGGINLKHPRRVGDSAIIGSGTYANEACAVSCTGQGEYFIRLCIAHHVALLVSHGHSLADAAQQALKQLARFKAYGGLISVDRQGDIQMPMNTELMFRASSQSGQLMTSIY